MPNVAPRCTCPHGFYDVSCPVHRYDADREQLERDLRRYSQHHRAVLREEEEYRERVMEQR